MGSRELGCGDFPEVFPGVRRPGFWSNDESERALTRKELASVPVGEAQTGLKGMERQSAEPDRPVSGSLPPGELAKVGPRLSPPCAAAST